MTEKLFLKDTMFGKGVFTSVHIKKGENVIEFQGTRYTGAQIEDPTTPEEDRYVQVGKDEYIGPSGGMDDYLNHSCDPNAALVERNGEWWLIAIKDIEPNEELRWDYSTTMYNDSWTMECACGSPNCRKIIREFRFLPKDLQQKYIEMGIVPEYNLPG